MDDITPHGSPEPPTAQEKQRHMMEQLRASFKDEAKNALFTCGGSIPIITQPRTNADGSLTPISKYGVHSQQVSVDKIAIRFGADGAGRVLSLPLSNDEDYARLGDLVQLSRPATFGHAGRDVYDPTYRQAVALSPEHFTTTFCPYRCGIIDVVTQLLLPPTVEESSIGAEDSRPSGPPRDTFIRYQRDLSRPEQERVGAALVKHTHGRLDRLGALVSFNHVRKCLDEVGVGPDDETDWGIILRRVIDITPQPEEAEMGMTRALVIVAIATERIIAARTSSLGRWREELKAKEIHKANRDQCRGIRAELYKLNVYSGPSGLFKPHVDTPRGDRQIGSLVVALPVEFEGGALSVRHEGSEIEYDWSTEQTPAIHWAAFYSDCEHEVHPVLSGHRLTLTYNLFLSPGPGLLCGNSLSLRSQDLPLASRISGMLRELDFMPEGGYLGFHLSHLYPHNTVGEQLKLVPRMLKGIDMAVHESVVANGLPAILLQIDPQCEVPMGREELCAAIRRLDSASEGGGVRNGLTGFRESGGWDYEIASRKRDKWIYDFQNSAEVVDSEDDMDYDSVGHCEEAAKWSSIEWIGLNGHRLPSEALLAYGNEASLEVRYSSVALVAKIPPREFREVMMAS